MRVLLAGVVLAVARPLAVGGEDEAASDRASRLSAALERLAEAGETQRLRTFRSEIGAWEGDPAAQADIVRAAWANAKTPAARVALVGAIDARGLRPAVGTLRAALDDPHADVVVAAVDLLGRWERREHAPAIVGLLPHADARVRAGAAKALGALGAPDAAPALRARSGDPDASVRARVAAALGRVGGTADVAVLVALLEDPAPGPRAEAATALGRLRATEHADRIARLLDAEESAERWRAARALGVLGAENRVPDLSRLLAHPDPWTRGFAAWSLGLLDARDHATGVAALLDDENGWVRVYALQALGRLGAHSSAPRIAARLTDMASVSLLSYDEPDAVDLAPAVVAETAMRVLARWGWDLASEARRIAKDLEAPDAEARSSAVEALVMMGAREHAPAIRARVADPAWSVRRDALWALAVLGAREHADAVAGALADPEPTIRGQALWSLGILRSGAHRAAVRAFLDDGTLAPCVAASTSPLPTQCIGRQTTLGEFAREALDRIGPE
jgi:HEAT repeat protein